MFFSVVVPVYNVEKYLKECVDSILNQTFTDFELILVDDGSKDSSGAICDEYAAKDNRVLVIHKENGGQSTARNSGVDCAKGDYVIFLDSDDFIAYNDFFLDLKRTMDDETDIVLFRYRKYFKNRVVSVGASICDISCENKGELLNQLVKRDTFFCSCWSKSVKLSILKKNKIKFNENLSCEDMDWYYSVLQFANHFKMLDKECINYRQRENSVTSTFKRKSITDYIFTIRKWYENFLNLEDGNEKTALLNSLAKLYCNLLVSYSAHIKELKQERESILSFKPLLKYNVNPRTAKFNLLSRILGLRLTCYLLNFISKVR